MEEQSKKEEPRKTDLSTILIGNAAIGKAAMQIAKNMEDIILIQLPTAMPEPTRIPVFRCPTPIAGSSASHKSGKELRRERREADRKKRKPKKTKH